MSRTESSDQVRRILALAVSHREEPLSPNQLELPFLSTPVGEALDPRLASLSESAHALLLELTLLIQMELGGLIDPPSGKRRLRRLGLGARPALRLLDEWQVGPTVEDDPWKLGKPAPNRETAFVEGLGRVRALAESCEASPSRVAEIARRLYAMIARRPPEQDLPGLILGHGERYTLLPSGVGRFAFKPDRARGRGQGAVHTPPELASELVGILRRILGETGEAAAFLDPACGSGQFLLATAAQVRGTDQESQLERLRSLHGVDLDPRAARVTAWNLSYWAALRTRPGEDAGKALDRRFGPTFPYFLGRQIQVGNSIQIEPSSFSPGFLWERRFPEVFGRDRPGFDIVMGNPPWVSFGLRDRVAAPEEERLYYERLYPAGTQYKLSLYPIFMELAVRVCREGGAHGFLVPDSLLSGHHFSRIRRHLLSATDLIELALIEAGTWPGVHVGHTVLYAVRKKKPGQSPPVSVRNRVFEAPPGRRSIRRRAAKESDGPLQEPIADSRPLFRERSVWVPSVQYSPSGAAPLPIFRDESELEFLTRIQSGPLRFRDVAWTYSGLIARHGQNSIRADRANDEFELRDSSGRLVLADSNAREKWRAALQSGSEVTPHRVAWSGGYVYWPARNEDVTKVFKSGYDVSRYVKPKVFLRQTGDQLIAAVDRNGLFCLNNVHLIGGREHTGVQSSILSGILMSAPVQRAYTILSLENDRPLAQVDLKTVEALPYPCDSTGGPIGSGVLPPKNNPAVRRLIRSAERSLAVEDPAGIVGVAEQAWRAGAATCPGTALKGREVLGILLTWLLEKLETGAAEAGTRDDARRGKRMGASFAAGPLPRPKSPPVHPSTEAHHALLDEMVALFFQIPTSATV